MSKLPEIARKRPKQPKRPNFVQAIPPGGSAARPPPQQWPPSQPRPRPQRQCRSRRSGAAAAATAAATAVVAGGRHSHRAGWLEQNFDVLAVSDAFRRFQAICTFWSVFCRFGIFFSVLGRFWSVSDLGFGFGNNLRRQVFEETDIWRLHYMHVEMHVR